MTNKSNSLTTLTLGYPRIGEKREVKKALESYWAKKISSDELYTTIEDIEKSNWQKQIDAGIDLIAVGDMSLYDHILDWTVYLGLIPSRFKSFTGLQQYFAMARGADGIPALEMTKWFDTNYHYLVPEIEADCQPCNNFQGFLNQVKRGQNILVKSANPIIISPVTLVALSRYEGSLRENVEKLLPLYQSLLEELKGYGITEIQIHEPILVTDETAEVKEATIKTYEIFNQVGLAINLVTYFEDLGNNYGWVINLPVEAISLDFTRGNNLDLLQKYGFPSDKRLGVGIVDARNVWQVNYAQVQDVLETVKTVTTNISIQPSASLQFVPLDVEREVNLPAHLRNILSFAQQKLIELKMLSTEGNGQFWQEKNDKWQSFKALAPHRPGVQEKVKGLTVEDFQRTLSYEERIKQQIKLPIFPTTTIGSFPQTKKLRRLRLNYKKGELSLQEYQEAIDKEIAECIKLQEDIGLDVLVHGEFERTDMVEFFGQRLSGFAFTDSGWVQSYGSRYVRPPIIFGDVERNEPMTIREFKIAQALTDKPVKGMLTGPVTMLNWSFPRADISRKHQAFQIALALQAEVADLQEAGALIIQMDEPAFREGLPLKTALWADYLTWAVDAFRLASAIALPVTQIHTHMCYSEFGDIIKDIEKMDADVISIENSRSNNRTLEEVTTAGYNHQIGNGVYDIHSPVVPSIQQMVKQLEEGIKNLPLQQIWVNPDCGLKTRHWNEVIPALTNMVEATKIIRQQAEK
ncbi:5-methyltetrahydropteroyltriglutamate--homocysteine S-methyltransferase [Cyanobacterium stanieri LEGE 03274]|uniref:5-methyltetrahydropteroyltriglutamate--homocysteine S-methyltransferase n=1 Tax=Cyanobacterium stanieri LEGE 03274 TaxID=1828756 RepID=A0ABR9V5H0_9CHRO|nr:5-methyltetrahydropteroyltriglutamate--homocysteine S-methyltransferase [Cyanobacterium stanieri]MBE9223137.1 5-methyltetrahydropteroyltriglutamate--homocysteine S-methyltransferase [Cyanobacterium stanieri LEGE 03274]